MDNFADVGFFFLVLFLIGWPLPFWMYLRDKKRKHPWQAFARAHGLEFVPDSFLGGYAGVQGTYRGYHLILGLTSNFKERGLNSCTHLGLSSFSLRSADTLPRGWFSQHADVADISRLLNPAGLAGLVKADPFGSSIYYEQTGIGAQVETLTMLADRLAEVADAYPALVVLGGEGVAALREIAQNQAHPFSPLALQLLEDIATDTSARFGDEPDQVLCLDCLTRYQAHRVSLALLKAVTYYGCRTCGKSRDFFRGEVVAALDNSPKSVQEAGSLYLNWLRQRRLFDFDRVEIRQATDEAVERFAVLVGNDTDPWRKPRYGQMPCLVTCPLSENTIRILQYTFGQVKSKG